MISWDRGQPIWKVGFLTPYPITIMLGIIISSLTAFYFWKRQKYPTEIFQVIFIIAIPTSILGARLWYAFSDPRAWSQFFVFSGMSIHGGVLFSMLCVLPYVYTKRHIIDIRTGFGFFAPSILIGQAIGRWGNFANHEVYGQIVSSESLDWLDWIGIKGHMYINGHYRAPLFLYESIANFTGYVLLVWVLLYKNYVRPGVTGALYFVVYGIIRASMEPVRDEEDIMHLGSIAISWLIAILMISLGLFLAIWWQFFSRPFIKGVATFLPDSWLVFFQKEYELITPIKPRRKYIWFGSKSDYRYRWTFFGKKVLNHVRLWIPKEVKPKWSKREINADLKKPKPKIKGENDVSQ